MAGERAARSGGIQAEAGEGGSCTEKKRGGGGKGPCEIQETLLTLCKHREFKGVCFCFFLSVQPLF